MKSMRLTNLAKETLSKKEMNAVKGGERCCECGCYYRNTGGSSISGNTSANQHGGGLQSPQRTADRVIISQDGEHQW